MRAAVRRRGACRRRRPARRRPAAEEAAELARPARAHGLDIIYLLAPTTPVERVRTIAHAGSGFLYYVAVTGVTGTRTSLAAGLETRVRALRTVTDLPIGVGFGISTAA